MNERVTGAGFVSPNNNRANTVRDGQLFAQSLPQTKKCDLGNGAYSAALAGGSLFSGAVVTAIGGGTVYAGLRTRNLKAITYGSMLITVGLNSLTIGRQQVSDVGKSLSGCFK